MIPRQVPNYIAAGDLEGRKEGKGVNGRWLVSISSVETLHQKRHLEGKHSVQDRDVAGEAEDTGRSAEGNLALIRELAKRLEDVQSHLGLFSHACTNSSATHSFVDDGGEGVRSVGLFGAHEVGARRTEAPCSGLETNSKIYDLWRGSAVASASRSQ